MSKTPKVVPIQEQQYRLIARDQKTQRIIIGMGSERFAIDYFRRFTKLPPETGDDPATVLRMEGKSKAKPRRPAAGPE